MTRMKRFMALALAGASLVACTDTPPVEPAAIATPAGWSRLGSERPEAPLAAADTIGVEQRWWQSFGDPVLDRLITEAIAGNQSLKVAEARVAEARAARAGTLAQLFPVLAIGADASRGNQGYATQNKPLNLGEADLEASWEADLFGKNQARTSAAGALVQSEEARRQGVRVSLLAEVARTYFDLRNAEAQIALTTRNLATQQRTLDIILAQRQGALSSELDVQRASAQVSTTAAAIPSLQAARDAALDRLNVLVGTAPGSQDGWIAAGSEPAPYAPLTPRILVAAPARVLAARPDIRAAERDLAASRASRLAATRELYPTLSLTALFGVQDSSLYSVTPWSIGAGLVQPVLNFGRIQSDIDQADARQTQAFHTYQATVLSALEDMENALSLYLNETARQRDLAAAAAQNRKAVELADRQYTAGYIGLLDLLVVQRNELDAESSLAASEALLRQDLVRIYAAAGGGWETETSTTADAGSPAGG